MIRPVLRATGRGVLVLLCLLLVLPVLAVLASWAAVDAGAWAVLRHQASTVLPEYALTSLAVALVVGGGVAVVGTATAAAAALFDWRGRRLFEVLLLLPLAMPAYVLAYAATDALQPSGALQSGLRDALGLRGALWPEVRSLPGAMVLFIFCLYPYVYLLVRGALGERAVRLMEAARLLGAPMRRRVLGVALPMARPALAAGVALAVMETLADYGVAAYFGLATFSTGVYRAWSVLGDRTAAAQLASLLLLVVALLLWVEQRAQARMQFASARLAGAGSDESREARPPRLGRRGTLVAWLLCGTPVLLGFVLPVAWLLRLVWREAQYGDFGLPWARFAGWALSSFQLAASAAAIATVLALTLAFVLRGDRQRQRRGGLLAFLGRLLGLGYALPGVVIAVGVLLPLGALQAAIPQAPVTAVATGTVAALLLAYTLRFCAVAQQSVAAGYARLPGSLDDSARLLGAGSLRLFGHIHLPLLQRATLAALLLVFVDTMKELPATLLLRPFGSDTLAVVAYNLARDERLAEAALPALAIVAVGLLPVMLLASGQTGQTGQTGRIKDRSGSPGSR
jgi:iron(III) transport system permease protein